MKVSKKRSRSKKLTEYSKNIMYSLDNPENDCYDVKRNKIAQYPNSLNDARTLFLRYLYDMLQKIRYMLIR